MRIVRGASSGTRRSQMEARLPDRRLRRWEWMFGRVIKAFKIIAVAGLLLWLVLIFVGGSTRIGAYAHDRMAALGGTLGLVLSDVRIDGRINASMDDVKNAISMKPGDPLYAKGIDDIAASLKSISWVADVQIKRILPGTIDITITERTPAAIWLDAPAGAALVSADGTVLTRDDIGRFGPLLGVRGERATVEVGPLIDILSAHPDIAVRIAQADWISNRRWNLITQEKITIKLPEKDIDPAIRRLEDAQTKEKLLDKTDLKAIDLRNPERIILETVPGKAQDVLKKAGKGGDNI